MGYKVKIDQVYRIVSSYSTSPSLLSFYNRVVSNRLQYLMERPGNFTRTMRIVIYEFHVRLGILLSDKHKYTFSMFGRAVVDQQIYGQVLAPFMETDTRQVSR